MGAHEGVTVPTTRCQALQPSRHFPQARSGTLEYWHQPRSTGHTRRNNATSAPKSNEDNCVTHGEHVRFLARKVENPGKLVRQDFRSFPYTLSAQEAVDQLDEYYGAWVQGLKSLLDSDLPRPIGPEQGPWHEDWLGLSLSHTHRWLIQKGAEILLMRDFYALHGRPSSDHFPRS